LLVFFFTGYLLEIRTEPFSTRHLLHIKEDVGNCWEDLGQALGIELSKLKNVKDDYQYNKERANEVLQIWMEEKGTDATVGRLAYTLIQIKHKRIAEKLFGM